MAGRSRFGARSPEEHEEAERFLEDLLGDSTREANTRTRRTTRARTPQRRPEPGRTRRPAPHLTPAGRAVLTAPTITPPSTSITAANVTDAGVYTVDPDPAIARQTVTGGRVQATREWLLANPLRRARPTLVASRETTSDVELAAHYDRLVSGLVRAGFPVSMWGASIANAELASAGATQPFRFASQTFSTELAAGTNSFSTVRRRLGAPGVRSWLQRAAVIAGVEWNDSSRSRLATSLQQVGAAASGSSPEATAVALTATLAHASRRLRAAFPNASDRAAAATSAARLDYPNRVAIPFLATTGGVAVVRSRMRGQATALPSALRGQATGIVERARALQQHLRADAPNSLAFLVNW